MCFLLPKIGKELKLMLFHFHLSDVQNFVSYLHTQILIVLNISGKF